MNKVQTDPWWLQSLENRISLHASDNVLRVAYFYPKPTPSTFRYRVFNMIEAIERSAREDVVASWFSMEELRSLLTVLPRLDVLVLVRTPMDLQVADLIAKARLFGVKLIFDCDDLVFDPKYAFLAAVNNNLPVDDPVELDRWFAYVSRLNATAQHCDAGMATNSFLAEKLAAVVCGPVHVLGNFLNKAQEDVSEVLLEKKLGRGHVPKDVVTIGYFSGSKTHQNDFLMVADVLSEMMSEDHELRLKLVGYVELTVGLMKFGDRITHKPYVNWLELQSEISEVDLNIAPLQSNAFAFSKSELKYFEAAVVGTFSCVSNSCCFEQAIPASELGHIVRDGNWLTALGRSVAYLAENRGAAHADRLAQHAKRRWSSANFGHKVADLLVALAK